MKGIGQKRLESLNFLYTKLFCNYFLGLTLDIVFGQSLENIYVVFFIYKLDVYRVAFGCCTGWFKGNENDTEAVWGFFIRGS